MSFLSSIRISRVLRSIGAIGAGLAFAGLAQAQLVYLTATLNGAQEVPPVPTPATGQGCYTFDPSTNILSYNITYQNLLGPENLAHIHQGAPGVAGPILVNLPLGTPKIGSAPLTAAQAAQLLAGNLYTNIHTTVFGGGEIRGQMTVIPPTTLICFGDGSSGPCPCGNNSVPGNNEGCLHSAGMGAKLVASGGTSIACDSLQLCASQMTGSFCIFLQGDIVPIPATPFGDGLRCFGGNLLRLATVPINAAGGACFGGTSSAPISIVGLVTPGARGYSVYYRDPPAFCTINTFNTTNGVQATWVP